MLRITENVPRITEEQVIKALPVTAAIGVVEEAFKQLADGSAINHPRRRVILPTGSVLHYMAAGTPKYFGLKAYSSNPKTGAHFTVLLYRTTDGRPWAEIEANHLGQIRTGAASGVATKYMARENSSVLGVIGSGFQAETQVEAVVAVRPIRLVRVWSRSAGKREEFARKLAERTQIQVQAVDTARDAVAGADVMVTATNAKEPVLEADWVAPGTHINAVGSNQIGKRELPTDLVYGKADLVAVDSVEQSKMESGDLMIPLKEDAGLSYSAVEFREIVAGRRAGRTNDTQITVFKSNGLAVEDVAAAGYVVDAGVYS
jgi:ornithine cyclodeaminase/alanine dehydrogenase-like protein (mu-crystallin family)